jgi:hypothetical protein
MTSLVRSNRAGLSRLERSVAAELELIQAQAMLAAAREVARIDAITAVTTRAMLAADQLAAIQGALARRRSDEQAEAWQRFIAGSGVNALGNVVLGLDRRL